METATKVFSAEYNWPQHSRFKVQQSLKNELDHKSHTLDSTVAQLNRISDELRLIQERERQWLKKQTSWTNDYNALDVKLQLANQQLIASSELQREAAQQARHLAQQSVGSEATVQRRIDELESHNARLESLLDDESKSHAAAMEQLQLQYHNATRMTRACQDELEQVFQSFEPNDPNRLAAMDSVCPRLHGFCLP